MPIRYGSEPLAAARRELQEETGYAGGQWELLMSGEILQILHTAPLWKYFASAGNNHMMEPLHITAREELRRKGEMYGDWNDGGRLLEECGVTDASQSAVPAFDRKVASALQ